MYKCLNTYSGADIRVCALHTPEWITESESVHAFIVVTSGNRSKTIFIVQKLWREYIFENRSKLNSGCCNLNLSLIFHCNNDVHLCCHGQESSSVNGFFNTYMYTKWVWHWLNQQIIIVMYVSVCDCMTFKEQTSLYLFLVLGKHYVHCLHNSSSKQTISEKFLRWNWAAFFVFIFKATNSQTILNWTILISKEAFYFVFFVHVQAFKCK